jgi:hypothetical protein
MADPDPTGTEQPSLGRSGLETGRATATSAGRLL